MNRCKDSENWPDHYLPDLYLDLPLTDSPFRGMAAVLDCYDRCLLEYRSDGVFFQSVGLPPLNAPENRDDLLVVRASESGTKCDTIDRKLPQTAQLPEAKDVREEFPGIPDLEALRDLPLQYRKETLEDGYQEWVVCLDVAAFVLTVRGKDSCDCHAVIRISDRSMDYSRMAIKPTQAYQWHITDNCDQRCKHCYLFAEDARLKCINTPWDQLILTLDEITEDATRRHAVPMPVISGGDPILHPDFWRFAEELHKRGMRWSILGNPFHLDEAACKRLYQLGCFKYQMSMDGLEQFHDENRKTGSFRATLKAIKLLNDAHIQSQLMATASRQNLEDILQCMDVAVEHHATSFAFARYCATAPEKAAESYPTPEEYRDFLYRYYRKVKEYEAT